MAKPARQDDQQQENNTHDESKHQVGSHHQPLHGSGL